jgi:small subunit ribosomal protein S9
MSAKEAAAGEAAGSNTAASNAPSDVSPATGAEKTGSEQGGAALTMGGSAPVSVTPAAAPVRHVRSGKRGDDSLGTGRRKTSVARVRIRAGKGKITINNRELNDYFPTDQDRRHVLAPLEKLGKIDVVDVAIRVHGGGISGQSGACMLGIARALRSFDPATEEGLRQNHFLTRDGRMKERKKYGLRGARRGTQFSKR